MRAGRGFTLAELAAVKLTAQSAARVGIAVDRRRRSHSEEALARNVALLKAYLARLVIFAKAGAKPRANEVAADTQLATSAELPPMLSGERRLRARAISAEDRAFSAYREVRLARSDKRLLGRRTKRAADKEAAAKEKAATGKK